MDVYHLAGASAYPFLCVYLEPGLHTYVFFLLLVVKPKAQLVLEGKGPVDVKYRYQYSRAVAVSVGSLKALAQRLC